MGVWVAQLPLAPPLAVLVLTGLGWWRWLGLLTGGVGADQGSSGVVHQHDVREIVIPLASEAGSGGCGQRAHGRLTPLDNAFGGPVQVWVDAVILPMANAGCGQ